MRKINQIEVQLRYDDYLKFWYFDIMIWLAEVISHHLWDVLKTINKDKYIQSCVAKIFEIFNSQSHYLLILILYARKPPLEK